MTPTTYTAIATIVAALIAGLVAFLSSMLSKEQKTSEFRYSWLNAVLDDVAQFVGIAEARGPKISTARTHPDENSSEASEANLDEVLAAYYRARIRLYPEDHAKAVAALEALHAVLLHGPAADRAAVDRLVREVVRTTHEALREEWLKVKRGEPIFRITKHVSLAIAILAALALPVGIWFAVH